MTILEMYNDLRSRISSLSEEVESIRPKEKYLFWWRCYKTGQEWRFRKCFTVEEMDQQEDYLTGGGRMRYYEIFKTKIIDGDSTPPATAESRVVSKKETTEPAKAERKQ